MKSTSMNAFFGAKRSAALDQDGPAKRLNSTKELPYSTPACNSQLEPAPQVPDDLQPTGEAVSEAFADSGSDDDGPVLQSLSSKLGGLNQRIQCVNARLLAVLRAGNEAEGEVAALKTERLRLLDCIRSAVKNPEAAPEMEKLDLGDDDGSAAEPRRLAHSALVGFLVSVISQVAGGRLAGAGAPVTPAAVRHALHARGESTTVDWTLD